MSESVSNCLKCARKITPSVSNRCMYCGADLPEEHHLSAAEKNRVFSEKMQQFKENEKNADNIVSAMKQSYGEPGKTSKKQRKIKSAQAVTDALSDINDQLSEHQKLNKSDL